ncbi:MAG TPA: GNAT family N-acetyltransferase [Methanothrix sp.]|nr:GNAT family N-acetyltransferase [Methanothrix sp.]HUM81169.1 GNAT family N-acetyltransferase [Methanothrix sp.]
MTIGHIAIGNYTIRDWRMDDAASIAQYANNKKIWINLRDAFPHPYTLADADAFLRKVMGMEPRTYFAIASDDEAIGSIALMPVDDVHRFTAELGYWLAEPFWGNGIMTDAVRALSDYAFNELGIQRIFAEPQMLLPPGCLRSPASPLKALSGLPSSRTEECSTSTYMLN